MANWLKNLKLKELSFVDRPANQHARVVLFKRNISEPVAKSASVEPPKTFVEAIAKARRDDPQLSRTAAMSLTRENFPQLFDAYQGEPIAETSRSVEKSAAVVNFEKRVDDIRVRDRCSKSDAWRTAAREFPDEVDAYRVA
jgi:hypothetical protein